MKMGKYVIGVLFVGFVGLMVWWEIASWSECLSNNTWYYCLRILSK